MLRQPLFAAALPPLIGWAAATGKIDPLGWILFAILFLWQMPHFFAIAWTYRKDYEQGGFVMLSNSDEDGRKVALQSFLFCVALIISTLLDIPIDLSEGPSSESPPSMMI